jgi:uncharacterized membrane protein
VIRILVPLAVLGGGLAAGGLMITVLGGVPLLRYLRTPREYVTVHKFLVTRFDPFMPLCLLLAIVSDAALVFFAPTGTVRALAVAGAVLYLGVMVISLTKNVPINKWLAALDPRALPDNWAELDPRERWGSWNSRRTAFAVLGFAANVILIGTLI